MRWQVQKLTKEQRQHYLQAERCCFVSLSQLEDHFLLKINTHLHEILKMVCPH